MEVLCSRVLSGVSILMVKLYCYLPYFITQVRCRLDERVWVLEKVISSANLAYNGEP